MDYAERIVDMFNQWLSPKVAALSKEEYADVLLALREEIDIMHQCVLDETD